MISLYDVLEASNGQLFGEPAAQLFEDFCIDADAETTNRLFVALRTEHGDTHQYIPDAIARGVSGVICSRPPDYDTTGVSVILVRDTIDALLLWSHYILGKYGTKVIGVSGSAGKSTAIYAVSQALRTRYSVHVGDFDHSGRIGVPLSLARLDSSHKFAVLRLDALQPGGMAAMVQAVQPEVAVMTDVDIYNSENFDSPEQIAAEMSILVDYLSPGGLAVLNYDDDFVRAMEQNTRADVRTVGIQSFGADLIAYNIVVEPNGVGFDLRYGDERHVSEWIPLLGRHHLYSAMMALSVGLHFDIPLEHSIEAISSLEPLPGRMNPLQGVNGCLLVDDTYSANPQSTLAALDWLQSVKDKRSRTFFVFADMDVTGKYSQVGHRTIGLKASDIADYIITQGTEASLTARAALDHGMDASSLHSTYATQDTVAALLNGFELTGDDIVLVKGGKASRMERVTRALLENPDDGALLVRQTADHEQISLSQPSRLSWVEIDNNALANNVQRLKSLIGDHVTLMAMVKADAYGHGAVQTAQTALLNGAEYLGVSSLEEATELRAAGIVAPILTTNHIPVHMIRQAIQQDITVTIFDLSLARAYDRVARELDKKVRVHIKIDSGMGRLGILPEETVGMFRHIANMQHLDVEGIYTHFSVADDDFDYTNEQLDVFNNVVRPLQATTGFKFKYIHAANSAAIIAHPKAHFNMVRAGIAMYGLHPSNTVQLPDGFIPVMAWKTFVVQVKILPSGHPVGYGNTYTTSYDEKIAILPVGYGDGFRRSPKSWSEVLIHGQRARIIGRVSMEKVAISVAHIPDVSIGDEVVLLGRQRDQLLTAEEIADWLDTTNYEVTCSILPRVPRR
jgi:alanine racemase